MWGDANTIVHRPPTGSRQRAVLYANLNALLWATGNGLVSTTLVVYLALELGAAGIAISMIVAAPRFAGVLRLAVPSILQRVSRKWFCISAYLASALVLICLPLGALPRWAARPSAALSWVVVLWCLYHLLEYSGSVALWSWLGDALPSRLRGRLIGHREKWLVLGRLAGMIASALLAVIWKIALPKTEVWMPWALSATCGSVLLAAAVVPLAFMTAWDNSSSAQPQSAWVSVSRALLDRRYRRLLTYTVWLSLVTGVTSAAQGMYPARVLGIPYEGLLLLRGVMRGGQACVAPIAGRWVDLYGNRPVMIWSQLLVAVSPLFFLVATPQFSWIVGGAYVTWIAYAGLNVGLNNVKLKLANKHNNSPFLAIYHTVGDLAFGAATLVGGLFFDILRNAGSDAIRLYLALFVTGFLGRAAAVFFAARLQEPGADRVGPHLRRLGTSVAMRLPIIWRRSSPRAES